MGVSSSPAKRLIVLDFAAEIILFLGVRNEGSRHQMSQTDHRFFWCILASAQVTKNLGNRPENKGLWRCERAFHEEEPAQ
ncbi:hypothetical protein [Rhizobium sp. BK251]|uniref:hypothetical protein n=1 Tax=Rhizobium sp. BK251 TaxID=2512125 RepID=UPI0010479155|nr:hypothetical protein [Rhizobium sp. BK251]